jgi:hypothetical protein
MLENRSTSYTTIAKGHAFFVAAWKQGFGK